MASSNTRKLSGAYFTPSNIAASLVQWVVRGEEDRLLDPSCGDGEFISKHRNSVGIEQDAISASQAIERAPWALVHEGDFFTWAAQTQERFDCIAGNPPFIRYQSFSGKTRERAQDLCLSLGVHFSGLASSWAPFVVAAASLLNRGARMSFVVPAEIGHAPYAAPLLRFLVERFSVVHIVAIKKKLFPALSEDCWILFTDGYGGSTTELRFTVLDEFKPMGRPPSTYQRISVSEWRNIWNERLRPYLVGREARELYHQTISSRSAIRFGELATVGIGYVSGANDFFHLRPSEARAWDIPQNFLVPTVRNKRSLPERYLTNRTVETWSKNDDPYLLLRLPKKEILPSAVLKYLDTEDGHAARLAYKCRVREPWYSVPDVPSPDYFLSYMSGQRASLVRNIAGCTCTNSLHAVRVTSPDAGHFLSSWGSSFVDLSAELEGHPLGGGMLKLEPREAARVALLDARIPASTNSDAFAEAVSTMRSWRHYGAN